MKVTSPQAMPKYLVVMSSLIDRINAGEFIPNYMLPSENELIKAYNVSRITVRKALDEMESQEYVFRRQGKGTFVNQNRVDESKYKKYSAGYSALIQSSGAVCRRLQVKKDIAPTGPYGETLGLCADEPGLFYNRIYMANDTPVFYVESCINHRAFKGIENYDFGFVSLSHLLRHVYEGQLYRRDRKIQSTKAGDAAQFLQIVESDPVLCLTYTSVVKVENEMIPFEAATIYARTDVVEIDPDHL